MQAPTDGVVIDGFKFVDYDRPGIIVGGGEPANGVKNCIIRNNYIENRRIGIRVAATSVNLEISGNTISGCIQNGIHHLGVGDNLISGNVLKDCGENGIFLPEQHVGSFTITNNNISNNAAAGVNIERSDIIVEGNIIEGNQIGINTNCGRTNIVVGDSNQVINNITTGIVIECGTNVTIENCIISGNGEDGIVNHGVLNVSGSSIRNNGGWGIFVPAGSTKIRLNTIANNGIHGIETGPDADEVEIIENKIEDNVMVGVMTSGAVTLEKNRIEGNGTDGILVAESADNVEIVNYNIIANNHGYGILVKRQASAVIMDNDIGLNKIHGIEIREGAGEVQIINNTIHDNLEMGVLTFSTGTFKGNQINDNVIHGILLVGSADNVEISHQNSFNSNGECGIFLECETSAVIKDNTIESSWNGADERVISCGIWIEGSARMERNIIQKFDGCGIFVHETAKDVVITAQNQIQYNRHGIIVNGPTLINNNIISNNLERAIRIQSPAHGVILNWNRIENNFTGISVLSGTTDVSFTHNIISNNVRGVFSAGAPKLRYNTIQYNSEYGIKIWQEGIDLGNAIGADSGLNAILNNQQWNVINEDSLEISAFCNYWGLNDAAEIDATIKDNDEDSLRGPVIFEPFLTDYNVGIARGILHGDTHNEKSILHIYPNPVSQSTTIQFTMSAEGLVNLKIIDISGRLVRSLVSDKFYLPGKHRILWDGQSGYGRIVPGGVYIVILKASQELLSQKLMLLK